MPSRSSVSQFLDGARRGLPVIIAASPFGILFGAIAVDNGLTLLEAVLMSAVLFAGASQMVGIELFGQDVAPWLIVFSIFAVNFRHVLYSASIGRAVPHWTAAHKAVGFFFLVDPVYAESERRVEQGRPVSPVWFAGMVVPIYLFWLLATALGAIFGGLIPDTHALGLDFLLPIYFLGLVMGFRGRPRWLPVVLASGGASAVAFQIVGSPWHVSIGAAAGVLLAAALAPGRKALPS